MRTTPLLLVLPLAHDLLARRKLALTHADLAPLNRRLVYASLTAYGETGPEADTTGFDSTALWARTGLMDLVRPAPDATPTRSLPGMGDHPTGVSLMAAIAMGLLRLGWIANLLSHSVISGFITASGLLIAASQLKHLLGIPMQGDTLWELGLSASREAAGVNGATLLVGAAALLFLLWARGPLKRLLARTPLPPMLADLLAKAGPVLAVIGTTVAVAAGDLQSQGVAVVGAIPGGLPALSLPAFDAGVWGQLALPALLISLIGFVESVSVAQTLAAKRRQRIDSNAELIGLGAANLASGVSGGFPVTGGFSRSVVNFDAGARSPMAGVFTAGGIALTALFFTPWFYYLPKATLAATIIVAVLTLVDLGALRRAWRYSKADFTAMLVTLAGVLLAGVEIGVIAGVGAALALHLWRTSQPHMAELGQMPGTEHFRNVRRHPVITSPRVLSIRVDESLYFANARRTEDAIYDMALNCDGRRHVVLLCSAINHIDASALDSLESLNRRLLDAGERVCGVCKAGQYQDQSNFTGAGCTKCPVGTATPDLGDALVEVVEADEAAPQA